MSEHKKIPVILDGDPGHDDAIAWVLARASRELGILAVTSCCGNQTIEKTTYNALRVCTLIGLHAPVGKGCPHPLLNDVMNAPSVHGESGLDGPALPEPALVCFGADCTTLLLFDPVRQAIAAVHAGWRGTAQGIAYKAVLRMQAEFGCAPEHIHAAIGPCIGRCCFEVGPEVPEAMRRSLGPDAEAAIELHGEKAHVDLKRLNRIWLERAGVQVIDICPDCTKCQPERFWSHRVTGGNRGSQAAIIRLKGGAPA